MILKRVGQLIALHTGYISQMIMLCCAAKIPHCNSKKFCSVLMCCQSRPALQLAMLWFQLMYSPPVLSTEALLLLQTINASLHVHLAALRTVADKQTALIHW